MSVIVGIDPGQTGAVAFLYGSDVDVYPMPTVPTGRNRVEIDPVALNDLLSSYVEPSIVVIEAVGGDPKFGGASAFTFGKSFGIILATVALRGFPMIRVQPQVWKKSVLVGTDQSKEAAIAYVRRRFPKVNLVLPGKKSASHDLAEAVCLALYGSGKV